MVALDAQGNVAAASSSNGATHKVDNLTMYHQGGCNCLAPQFGHAAADMSGLTATKDEGHLS